MHDTSGCGSVLSLSLRAQTFFSALAPGLSHSSVQTRACAGDSSAHGRPKVSSQAVGCVFHDWSFLCRDLMRQFTKSTSDRTSGSALHWELVSGWVLGSEQVCLTFLICSVHAQGRQEACCIAACGDLVGQGPGHARPAHLSSVWLDTPNCFLS